MTSTRLLSRKYSSWWKREGTTHSNAPKDERNSIMKRKRRRQKNVVETNSEFLDQPKEIIRTPTNVEGMKSLSDWQSGRISILNAELKKIHQLSPREWIIIRDIIATRPGKVDPFMPLNLKRMRNTWKWNFLKWTEMVILEYKKFVSFLLI